MERIDLKQLYANYKKTPDDEIRKLLEKIVLVDKTHKGVGTPYGYYKFNEELMRKILDKPRNTSHTFERDKIDGFVDGLKEHKTIKFLVKSSSRFFLKPDIGEVFDQMSDEDKQSTKAIYTNPDSATEIDGTGGEHFVLDAVLLS